MTNMHLDTLPIGGDVDRSLCGAPGPCNTDVNLATCDACNAIHDRISDALATDDAGLRRIAWTLIRAGMDPVEAHRVAASEPAEVRGDVEFRPLPTPFPWGDMEYCACIYCTPRRTAPNCGAGWDTVAYHRKERSAWRVHCPRLHHWPMQRGE